MTDKPCPGGPAHDDALSVTTFVFDRGGKSAAIELHNDEIGHALGFTVDHGHGHVSVDGARYQRARRHAMDCVDENGRPCCGYRLNYRRAGRESILGLIDPTGNIAEHAMATIASVTGWITRIRQHQTENGRITGQLDALGNHALSRGDRYGYRLCIEAQIEIDQHNTLSPLTIGALQVWAQSL